MPGGAANDRLPSPLDIARLLFIIPAVFSPPRSADREKREKGKRKLQRMDR
jgi:hypothetical protein